MDRSTNTRLTFLIGSLLAAVHPKQDVATNRNGQLAQLYRQSRPLHEEEGSG